MAALAIVAVVLLLVRDFQFRQARDALDLERASRWAEVEAALTEGFGLGASLFGEDPPGGPEAGDRVPAGAGGAS